MVQGRESQSLVRIEDNGRWQLRWVEELLVGTLNVNVQPHPLHLGASVRQLRSELLGQRGEHVGLGLVKLATLEVNNAEALALEADVPLRLRSQLRDLLHEPRLGLLNGL